MQVVYISKYAAYPPYGYETRQVYISRSLVQRGMDVTLYTSTSNHILSQRVSAKVETVDGIKVHWISTLSYTKPYGFKRVLSWLHFEWRLRKELRKVSLTDTDIVIVSSLSLLSIWNGIYLKNKFGSKLIFEVRDIWPAVLERIGKISPSNIIFQLLASIELEGYKKADKIIGTMPNLSEHVEKRLGFAKPVLWLPHLLNPNVVYAPKHSFHAALTKLKKNAKNILIGFAGSINRSSALNFFLDAAAQFDTKNVHFLILGEGALKSQYKDKYSSETIHFYDQLPQQEVVAFLKDCDILYDGYMKGDIYRFGSSRNKYIEYASAAKPILVSYSGFPLFVEEYKCGVVVEPESVAAIDTGLKQLLENKESWDMMGQNAIRFSKDMLQLESQVGNLLAFIHE